MKLEPKWSRANVAILILWMLLTGQAKPLDIQKVIDRKMEEIPSELMSDPEFPEALKETTLFFEETLRIEEWPKDRVFAQSPDIYAIIKEKITEKAHNRMYLHGGTIHWAASENARVSLDYSIHQSAEEVQYDFLDIVAGWRGREIMLHNDAFPGAIVVSYRYHVALVYRNLYLRANYRTQWVGIDDRMTPMVSDEDARVFLLNMLKEIYSSLKEVPVSDDYTFDLPAITYQTESEDQRYMEITGEDQYVFFNIPEELAEYEIRVEIPEGDFTVRDRTERISPRQSRWTGRPVKPGTARFNVRGVGPHGELLRQQIAIEIKGEALNGS